MSRDCLSAIIVVQGNYTQFSQFFSSSIHHYSHIFLMGNPIKVGMHELNVFK